MSALAYRARRATGLSQRRFAQLIDVHAVTVARWESGEREPTAATRTLLLLIDAQPDVCLATILSERGRLLAMNARAGQ